MKKLFSMAIIFVLALTLVGCKDDGANELEFTFTDEYDVTINQSISYEEDYDGEFIDLLESNFDFNFSESDYGTLLLSIEHLFPRYGAFIGIAKNGTASDVGIDLIEFEDGDSFVFEVVWWDELQEDVDDSIQLFLENHATDYVNSEGVDYSVLVALNLLGITDDFVSALEVETLVDDSELVTVADYFKAIMKLNAVGSDSSYLINELNSIVEPGFYGQTAYGLLAMNSITSSVDYDSFELTAIFDLHANTPFSLGLDAGGISLVALSEYDDYETLVNVYTTWISNSQIDSGGVLTRDLVWGETTYPGTENASSISQVILGLIANDFDPTGVLFTKNNNNLITSLLSFNTDTGSFNYTDAEDLVFSTPQAFLALVTYQVYANTFEAVNPYDFK